MASFILNIDVDDLERGIAFYCAAFELREGRRLGKDFAELLGGETPIYLLTKKPDALVAPGHEGLARSYARHWTPVHFDFVVTDIAQALARAEAAGAKRESEITQHAYGKLVLLADPFGHGLCLLQFEGSGYDALIGAT